MSWDLQIDPLTGDLVWNANLDLAPVLAEAINNQRIGLRLKVDYGSYAFNPELGSRLRTMLNLMGIPSSIENIKSFVYDALEPMTDITVVDIDVSRNLDGSVQASVQYQLVANTSDVDSPDITPEDQAIIQIPPG